jgi:alpha-methylacyl-CoA racemase
VVRVNRGLDLPDDPHIKARSLLQRVGDLLLPRSPIPIRDRNGERPPPESGHLTNSLGDQLRELAL